MAMPQPVRDVHRDEVYKFVALMLLEREVGDVRCVETSAGKYTITPRRTVFPAARPADPIGPDDPSPSPWGEGDD